MVAKKYNAFISYRHLGIDEIVAKRLHYLIESYSIPRFIKRSTGISSMGRVFRDQEELPLSNDLGEDIHQALDNSEWLICICSSNYKESRWCIEELNYFIKLGKRDHILTVLVDGEPGDSFPEVLLADEDGNPIEPLAADVRSENVAGTLKKLKDEKYRILAPMLGVGYDDLKQRFRQRRNRIIAGTATALAVVFAALFSFVLYKNSQITKERNSAQISQSKYLAKEADGLLLAKKDRMLATLLAKAALPSDFSHPNRPVVQEALSSLRSALINPDAGRYGVVTEINLPVQAYASYGDELMVCSDEATGFLACYDLNTGVIRNCKYELDISPFQIRITDDLQKIIYVDTEGIKEAWIDENDTAKYKLDCEYSYFHSYDIPISVKQNGDGFIYNSGYHLISHLSGPGLHDYTYNHEYLRDLLTVSESYSGAQICECDTVGNETYKDGIFLVSILDGKNFKDIALLKIDKTCADTHDAVIREYDCGTDDFVYFLDYKTSYDGKLLFGLSDEGFYVWETDSTDLLYSFPINDFDGSKLFSMAVSQDNDHAAICTEDGHLYILSVTSGEITEIKSNYHIDSVHFNKEHDKLLCSDLANRKAIIFANTGQISQIVDSSFDLNEVGFTNRDSYGNAIDDSFIILVGEKKSAILRLGKADKAGLLNKVADSQSKGTVITDKEIWYREVDTDAKLIKLVALDSITGDITVINEYSFPQGYSLIGLARVGDYVIESGTEVTDMDMNNWRTVIKIYDSTTHEIIKTLYPTVTWITDDGEEKTDFNSSIYVEYQDSEYSVFTDTEKSLFYIMDNSELEIKYAYYGGTRYRKYSVSADKLLVKGTFNSVADFQVIDTQSWTEEANSGEFFFTQLCDIVTDVNIPGFSDLVGIYVYNNKTIFRDLRSEYEVITDFKYHSRACICDGGRKILLRTDKPNVDYYVFDGSTVSPYNPTEAEISNLPNEEEVFEFGEFEAYIDGTGVYDIKTDSKIFDLYDEDLVCEGISPDGQKMLIRRNDDTSIYLLEYKDDEELLELADKMLNGREMTAEEKETYFIEDN